MNRRLLLLAVIILRAFIAEAQPAFTTRDSLDINNLNSAILVHGDMWWNPQTQLAQCEFPKGTRKNVNFASAIWLSGYDAGNQLHIAAQTYRQTGNDFWPGPLDTGDTLTLSTSTNWAKIWKVNRTEINAFTLLPTHTIANTPPSILTWPGKGNVNAQGSAAAALTILNNMAPFVDLNGNGIYEPLLGEYPDVRGDQALWWVFSDRGPAHTETNGRPLGVEIHALAYAYARGTLMDNVQYYSYTIINRSAENYSNFRFALHSGVDLGYYGDDYIGFDSSWRLGYVYNSENVEGNVGFPTAPAYYAYELPISGVTLIDVPGDAGTTYEPVGSFTYYNNDFSVIGNPSNSTQYDNYMRAKVRNGDHYTNDYTGHGYPAYGFGGGPNTDYVYTGDPTDTNQWSECNCMNIPGDRNFTLSTRDFTLNAGAQQKVVMALVVTPLDSFHACPDLAHFNDIRVVTDTAWAVYRNPPPLIPAAIAGTSSATELSIYPNPARNEVTIEGLSAESTIDVYNAVGQKMDVTPSANGQKYRIDVSSIPAGVYLLRVHSDHEQKTALFTKY